MTYFGARFLAKLPVQFGAPTTSSILAVRRKFLILAVGMPMGFCNPFGNVVRFAVFESERRASRRCLLSKREDLEQPYVDNVRDGEQFQRLTVHTGHREAKWDLVTHGVRSLRKSGEGKVADSNRRV